MNKLYNTFIKPRSQDRNSQNRELVLNYILLGLIVLSGVEFLTSLFGFITLDQHYLAYRLLGMLVVLLCFCTLFWFARWKQMRKFASFIIICALFLTVSLVALNWGTVTPTGTLLFGLIVVISGILLGSRFAIYSAMLSSIILILLEYLKAHNVIQPNLSWMQRPSSMSDIMGFSTIFAIIALVSWLFNRQMEQSLERAQKSEAALERQNDLLEHKVEERTRQLEAAQLEKLQQVYRFAELGRISSALFHDLANHLTSVSLNIEDYNAREQSGLMQRVQHDISYIDEVVQRVRLQLRGQGSIERFNIAKEVHKVLGILNYKLVQNNIRVSFEEPGRPIMITADLIPFRQIINNLISNAIDAYDHAPGRKQRRIQINLSQTKSTIKLTVTDWGIGVPPEIGSRIFDPFYSNKTDGTGIGLFIVKQIVENDLHGTINLSSDPTSGTKFSVALPRHHGKAR